MNQPPPFGDALIAEAIEHALGEKPERVTHLQTKAIRGVFAASLPGGRDVILKLEAEAPADEWRLGLEAWAMQQAADIGVPVPAVLATDLGMSRLPFRYVVMEKAAGLALNEAGLGPEDLRAALRNAGRLLARLHRVRLAGFGSLDEQRYLDSGEVMGRFARWAVPSTLRAEAALNELSGAGVIDFEEAAGAMHIVETAAATVDDAPSRLQQPARLLHGDFSARHVFVEPASGAITALIDFGDRMAGPPVWDLAGAWLWHIGLRGLPPNATAQIVQGWEAESGTRITKEEFSAACLMRLIVLARAYHDAGRVSAFEELRFHLRTLLEDAGRL
jgi:aminoglycoside phosphotransferase (APT) family kinase protein